MVDVSYKQYLKQRLDGLIADVERTLGRSIRTKDNKLKIVTGERVGQEIPTDGAEAIVIADKSHRAHYEPTQVYDWLKSTHILANRILQNEASDAELALFWIRLSGVVNDLYEKYCTAKPSQFTDVLTDTDCGQTHAKFVDAIAAVWNALEPPERQWLEYMRLRECHPTQDKYALSDKRNVFGEREPATIGERFPRLKYNDRIMKFKEARPNPAMHIASKVAAPLYTLLMHASYRTQHRP